MATKGYSESDGKAFLVGAADNDAEYQGPVARIEYDKTWLYITTDHYEGRVILNIEALPYLRQALTKILSEITRAKQKPLPEPPQSTGSTGSLRKRRLGD